MPGGDRPTDTRPPHRLARARTAIHRHGRIYGTPPLLPDALPCATTTHVPASLARLSLGTMNAQQLLDPLPIAAVFVLFAVISLIAFEVGFRLGRRWQTRRPRVTEGPTG